MTSRGPLGPRRQGSVKSSLGGSGYRKDESGGRTRRRGSFTVPASSGSGRASSSCLRGMPSNWRAACVAWEFTWPSGPCPSRGRPWRSSVAGLRSGLNMLTIGPRTLEIAALGCLRVVRAYAEAGVSQDEKAAHIAALVAALRYRRKGLGKPLTKIGHFTGLVDFGSYALSLCTDSVGTKVLIAKEMRRWDTIGIDCVAMNVNDMICIGAEPLAFVDYVAISDYDREVARQIGIGLNRGAELADVSIIGGGGAVVPGLLPGLDLAGARFRGLPEAQAVGCAPGPPGGGAHWGPR